MTNNDVYKVSEEAATVFQPFYGPSSSTNRDRKRQYESLAESLSDYFDYPDPVANIHDDLQKALRDLNSYHQEKATNAKALLARLSLMS